MARGVHLRHNWAVTNARLWRGIGAGVTAAAAVVGGLVTFAARGGAPLDPLVTSGRSLLVGASPALALLVGLGMRLADGVLWGVVLAVLLGGRRSWPWAIVGGVVVAAFAAVVHDRFIPALRLGYGLGVFPLHGAPLYFLYALFAAALAVGMRIAR